MKILNFIIGLRVLLNNQEMSIFDWEDLDNLTRLINEDVLDN